LAIPSAGKPELRLRPWLAPVVGLCSLCITLIFWQVLRSNERANIRRFTSLAAANVQADLEADVRPLVQALIRLAYLRRPIATPEWDLSVKLYLSHHPACKAIEWVDPSYHVREVAPLHGNEAEVGLDLSKIEPVHRVLAAAQEHALEALYVANLKDAAGIRLHRVVVPVYRDGEFQGFVVGVFDVSRAIGYMLEDIRDGGYSVAVLENGEEIYRLPQSVVMYEADWGQTTRLSAYGAVWNIRVWPKPEVLSQMKSDISKLALALGSTISLLLMLGVHFAQALQSRSRALQASQRRLAKILETSSDAIICVNEQQRITMFNEGAEEIFGYRAKEIVGQPLDLLVPGRFRELHRSHVGHFDAATVYTKKMGDRRPVSGVRRDGTEFPLEASISKLEINGEKVYTAILRDITERVRDHEELRVAHDELEVRVQERTTELARSNKMLRELSGHLLQAQDQERRRIARELHDSIGQELAAINVNVSTCQGLTGDGDPLRRNLLGDSVALTEHCMAEVRTISHLLHPPLLDDFGLVPALQWYAEGFSRRSGIQVDVALPPKMERLPDEVELTLFRVVQETFTNIHRHSGSATASISLTQTSGGVVLQVADEGKGIPAGVLEPNERRTASLGVGIAGMRERVTQLDGSIEIQSGSEGTTITVSLPLPEHAGCATISLLGRVGHKG
jgi:PAS domain S-box-containing protein